MKELLKNLIREMILDEDWEKTPDFQPFGLHDDLSDSEKLAFKKAGWLTIKALTPFTKKPKTITYNPKHWQTATDEQRPLFGLFPTSEIAKKEYNKEMKYYENLTKTIEN